MDDYEVEYDLSCPDCGHSPLLSRDCINLFCEDGYIEEFLDDVEIPGTGYEVKCQECKGTGVERWCPKCGANLSGDKRMDEQFREIEKLDEGYYKSEPQI